MLELGDYWNQQRKSDLFNLGNLKQLYPSKSIVKQKLKGVAVVRIVTHEGHSKENRWYICPGLLLSLLIFNKYLSLLNEMKKWVSRSLVWEQYFTHCSCFISGHGHLEDRKKWGADSKHRQVVFAFSINQDLSRMDTYFNWILNDTHLFVWLC